MPTNSYDLYRLIGTATERMRELTGSAFHADEALKSFTQSVPKGDKPIPKRKRRYHANAEQRALRRWDGAQKMLKLLAPAGVRSDARAMDALTRKFGI